MPGRFEGLTDEQWKMIDPLIPEEPYVFGRPHPDRRKLLNTILYVLITGCRWCDVPIGSQWAKRSTAHKYLGKWLIEGKWGSGAKNRVFLQNRTLIYVLLKGSKNARIQ